MLHDDHIADFYPASNFKCYYDTKEISCTNFIHQYDNKILLLRGSLRLCILRSYVEDLGQFLISAV